LRIAKLGEKSRQLRSPVGSEPVENRDVRKHLPAPKRAITFVA
jgi:hypothetical protein